MGATLRAQLLAARQRTVQELEDERQELAINLINLVERELANFLDMDAETATTVFTRLSQIPPANQSRYADELGLMTASDIIADVERETGMLNEETNRRVAYRHKLMEVGAMLGHFGLRLALLTILA